MWDGFSQKPDLYMYGFNVSCRPWQSSAPRLNSLLKLTLQC